MARRWESWTPATLPEIAEPCGSCVEWQLAPVEVRARPEAPSDRLALKREWLREAEAAHGSLGQVLRVDGEVAGYVAYAPACAVPRISAFPTAPVTPDAYVLIGLWAAEPSLCKTLVQRAVRELSRRDVRGLEAFGGGAGVRGCFTRPPQRGGPCRYPGVLLERVGFRVVREHPTVPRYRLEVGGAVAVLGQLEHGVAGLAHALRRRPGTEPSLGRCVDDLR